MPRHISPKTTLENLKREAKRWLSTLREHTGEAAAQARVRLERSNPGAPSSPGLRDVQLALAREFGFDGWTSLKQWLDRGVASDADAQRVSLFLEHACPDHHVRGGPAHSRARHAALRMLQQYPEIAHETFYTSVVCGELSDVERTLAERPSRAGERNRVTGPDRSGGGGEDDQFRRLGGKPWEPLLFLCFTRLPIDAVTDNAVPIAAALLDSGADPNAFFMAGSSRYTSLVGVIGEGEEGRPPHQQRDALTRLLLERGADPYDIQVLYNIHFHGNILWYLKLAYEYSLRRGRAADWADPDWSMLGMGGYGSGAHYLLKVAVGKNDLETAEWILEHGASPNLPFAYSHPKFRPQRSLYEEAVRDGHAEMAELLVRHGATPSEVALTGIEEFTVAALRLDRARAARLVAEHPEYLKSTAPIFAAIEGDRADVAELLLDLGVSPDVANDRNQRPLHEAAYRNALKIARLLLDRGAAIDPVGAWGGSPLGAAVHAQNAAMIALLAPRSNDFWELVYVGAIDRVREILRESPERARVVTREKHTPLMWLAFEDEPRALEMARLLLSYGADPTIVNADGQTAADRAERLGMLEVATLLRAPRPAAPPSSAGSPVLRIEDYELRAQALLDAYRMGTDEAMERHWRLTWHRRTWSAMRTYVQLDLGRAIDDPDQDRDITLDDARFLIAREFGFENRRALEEYVAALPATAGAIAAKPLGLLATETNGKTRIAERTREWGTAFARIAEQHLDGLAAQGQMTDALLEHVAGLEHITVLRLGGSKGVTDDGLRLLARLPHLRHLELDGCAITDRGLEVVRSLPELRSISLAWTAVTDEGAAHLTSCDLLENVNLGGTRCGDGAIAALAGKARLHHLTTGNAVTDAGLPLVHELPVFKKWHGGDVSTDLTSYDNEPNQLVLRGTFTDRGMASLAGLDGLAGLNLDDSELAVTGAGLAPITSLPHLGWLAFDAKDDAMPYIAAIPALRFLGCQDTRATNDGWVALSRSRSIETIWGRRCYGLGDRGFIALSTMPALRRLAASCKNVSDDALAALPRFSALRQLMPMDIPDAGYRHIGRCEELTELTLMYCRDTTDRSTELIAGLPRLRRYFASYNQITDRSLEILSGMDSLEEIELSAVAGITNAGVGALARLPRLREVRVSGNRLTRDVVSLFPPRIHAHYEL